MPDLLPPVDRNPTEPGSAGPKPDGRKPLTFARVLGQPVTATAQAALQWYIDNDGLAERPDGSNVVLGVTDRCDLNGQPWCAMSASVALMAGGFGSLEDFRMDMPGVPTDYLWGWAYCPSIVQAFRDAGRWSLDSPQPGDLVLFDWDSDNWADHVGLVERDLGDGTVLTREGNADNRVCQKRRAVADILGYGRPPYADTSGGFPMALTDDQQAALKQETHETWEALGGFQDLGKTILSRLNDLDRRIDKLALTGLPDQITGKVVIDLDTQ